MTRGASNGLWLLVPGLFGPVAGADIRQAALPDLPGLRRWLQKARSGEGLGGEGLARVAGLFPGVSEQCSAATLSYLGATGRAAAQPVLRADPIYLRVETDHLMLFDAGALEVSAAEAEALVSRFNEFYREDGLWLEAPRPNEWFLCAFPGKVQTTPLDRVRARSIGPFMPDGSDGAALRALINEVQMLFFEHPVNRQREADGRLTVSGIWPWGEGHPLPDALPAAWDAVWSDDSLVRGAARLGGTTPQGQPAVWDDLAGGPRGRTLVTLDAAQGPASRGDVDGWLQALQWLDDNWFQPLSRHSGAVTLLSGDGRALEQRGGWLPWRRGLSLGDLLHAPPL